TDGHGIAGPSPGLENAAATAFNLVDMSDGRPGAVVTNADNASSNDTLATLATLGNLVSLCAASSPECDELLRLATPPGGPAPQDTVGAIVALARDPTLSPDHLFALAGAAHVFEPALTAAPSAWTLVLLYTDADLYASGRIAIDAQGNVWSSNNWVP